VPHGYPFSSTQFSSPPHLHASSLTCSQIVTQDLRGGPAGYSVSAIGDEYRTVRAIAPSFRVRYRYLKISHFPRSRTYPIVRVATSAGYMTPHIPRSCTATDLEPVLLVSGASRRRAGPRRSSVAHVRRCATRTMKRLPDLPPIIRKVIESVSQLEQPVSLAQLSDVMNRSPSHLNVMFFRATGLTIRQYVLFLRMTYAAREIERGTKIEVVAMLVGYRSKKNFYRQFKTWFGVNPTALRGLSRSPTQP
jgi:AraC-like DNA-binding protein